MITANNLHHQIPANSTQKVGDIVVARKYSLTDGYGVGYVSTPKYLAGECSTCLVHVVEPWVVHNNTHAIHGGILKILSLCWYQAAEKSSLLSNSILAASQKTFPLRDYILSSGVRVLNSQSQYTGYNDRPCRRAHDIVVAMVQPILYPFIQ